MELIGSLDCGSIIAEMALALTGMPYKVTDLPYLQPGSGRDRLLALNPLGQVPTLVLGHGRVLTESAAIILHLNDLAPRAGLLPRVGAAGRALALNRLIQLVAAVYPTFTYGDDPARWVPAGPPADALRASTDAAREAYFARWEAEFDPGPFAAGAALTALDLYLVAMTNWRPRRDWFAANTPKLLATADAAAAEPRLAPVVARHRAAATVPDV